MSDFDKAIVTILKHEGGWVDHPADPGGETNFGISMLMVKREGMTPQELGIPSFDKGNMKLMSVDTAKKIYRKFFWDKAQYDLFTDDVVATKVFDCAVNCGPGRSHKMAQQAANKLGQTLTVDGKLGPKSFAAINSCDPKSFLVAMSNEMKAYYDGLVAAKPALQVFIKNWTKRAAWMG